MGIMQPTKKVLNLWKKGEPTVYIEKSIVLGA